jgi:glycosyltransferase involved in cell wall biosynthesis
MKERLRILYIIGNSVVGGAENHLLTLVRALDPAQHRLAVICPRPGPLVDVLQSEGVEVYLVEMVKPAPNDEYELDLAALWSLFSIIREWHPHVVHSHLYPAHLHATLAGQLAGAPALITTAHTLIVRPGDSSLIRMANGHIIAVSEHVKSLLVKAGVPTERIQVIYNGIEPHYFQDESQQARKIRQELGVEADTTVIGVIARLSPEKGHTEFLDIARELAVQRANTKFLVVGTGPVEAELHSMARDLGLEEQVIFTGARQDITAINHVIDIFALPSREEALPLAMLEAMAARRPVVESAVGGVPEVVVDGETGFLLSPDDRTGFVQALTKLIDQPDLRAKLGFQGRQRAHALFGVEQMIHRTTNFYRSLVAGHGGLEREV